MSSIVNEILSAGGGQVVQMLGGRFGLSPAQAQAAVSALGPMIAGGMKQQAQERGGLEGLLGSVINSGHSDMGNLGADMVAKPGVTAAGNEILGQIFGSKDVSRAVATHAAGQTGISVDLLKQMLPVLASVVASSMASKANAGGLGGLLGGLAGAAMGGGQTNGRAGGLGALAGMIDFDHDGNPLNDIMGMLAKR